MVAKRQYSVLRFDDQVNEGDMTIENRALARWLTDEFARYLVGGSVDYTEDFEGSRFCNQRMRKVPAGVALPSAFDCCSFVPDGDASVLSGLQHALSCRPDEAASAIGQKQYQRPFSSRANVGISNASEWPPAGMNSVTPYHAGAFQRYWRM